MKEQVPCLLDARKDCAQTCELYAEAKTQWSGVLHKYSGEITDVQGLRDKISLYDPEGYAILVQAIMQNFAENGDLESCKQYQEVFNRES